MPDSSPTILITGATGLVGSHLLYRLASAGYQTRAFVRKTGDYRQVLKSVFLLYSDNTQRLLESVEFVEGDLTDIPSIQAALKGITDVFHCAGSQPGSILERNAALKLNGEGTANLINCSLEAGINWLGHISTVETLGSNPEGLIDEDFFWKPAPDVSGFAVSKYVAEQEVWRGFEEGLPVLIVNPSFIFGPSVSGSGGEVLFKFIRNKHRKFTPGSSGYVGVWDVAETLYTLFEAKVTGQRFIVSSENLETGDLLRLISKQLNIDLSFEMLSPTRTGSVNLITRLFQGKHAARTNYALKNAAESRSYDNARIIQEISIPFMPVEAAIEKTIALQKKLEAKENKKDFTDSL